MPDSSGATRLAPCLPAVLAIGRGLFDMWTRCLTGRHHPSLPTHLHAYLPSYLTHLSQIPTRPGAALSKQAARRPRPPATCCFGPRVFGTSCGRAMSTDPVFGARWLVCGPAPGGHILASDNTTALSAVPTSLPSPSSCLRSSLGRRLTCRQPARRLVGERAPAQPISHALSRCPPLFILPVRPNQTNLGRGGCDWPGTRRQRNVPTYLDIDAAQSLASRRLPPLLSYLGYLSS
ncbi:hypothetical protein GGS23DRAFT_194771 [Durotheca rogersii]|uniref:uncharacterized protein n=1 Tax=Durotheca rogersii TaxID=419775 RepID=UPI00221F6375|nr:uncharacterized protein GGS23DRAFT_194771 [Durotheca rogersii]KAI5867774.1 hypothetical protein GGS23DRAFT_194771 [Durotheca rogersii]